MKTLIALAAMPTSITLLQKHGQTSPPLQTNQSPPLLLAPTSAPPSPSTIPMPSLVPLEHPQAEEKPTSTALMAQTPSPPPAPPLAPSLLLGVPSPTPQTNQSPPLLVALPSAPPSPSTTPMPSSVHREHPPRGDAYLYRLDGSDAFTSTCATTGTLTSPWCTLSRINRPTNHLPCWWLFLRQLRRPQRHLCPYRCQWSILKQRRRLSLPP